MAGARAGMTPVRRKTKMAHRDPQTGQFVSSGAENQRDHGFDGIEVATFHADFGMEAADLTGGTGFTGGDGDNFEGIEVIDFGDFCDRNERLQLLHATHILTAYANSTETADGTVRIAAEVSASPSRSSAVHSLGNDDVESSQDTVVGGATTDDSIDILGAPLIATGHAPFSDGASGVGGGGSAGEAVVRLANPPAPICDFHPRDELFVNGGLEVWNVDDAGVHGELTGQHIYGVVDDL